MGNPLPTPPLRNVSTPRSIWIPRNIQQREFPPTWANACLDQERWLAQKINDCGGLLAICPGRKWTEPPWVRMPTQGKRFSKISSIPLPPATGTDTLIGSFRVPYGYDGCIVSVVFSTDGTLNFQQGSGDLIWRLQLNERWVRDYGNVNTYIGSLTTPYSINSGQIILQSGQLVRIWGNQSTSSSAGGGRMVGAAFGWFWPR